MLWKGRWNFKQYIPSKRHRFGVKLFPLFHCRTDFIIDFIVCAGRQTEVQLDRELGISGSIVMTLMNSYLAKGHMVFVDN